MKRVQKYELICDQVTRKADTVNKLQDPTSRVTYKFSNGCTLTCIWEYELCNQNGVRITYTNDNRELNKHLRECGIKWSVEELQNAFDWRDATWEEDPMGSLAQYE